MMLGSSGPNLSFVVDEPIFNPISDLVSWTSTEGRIHLQSSPWTVPPWMALELFILLLLQNSYVDLVHHFTSLGQQLEDASSGPFLSCLLAAVPLSCITAPLFNFLLWSWSASLLQTAQTRPELTPIASPELLDSPCAMPMPALTLGYLFLWPMRETLCSLLGKTIRANNILLNISGNMIYLNLPSKSSSTLIEHSEAFRNKPKSSFHLSKLYFGNKHRHRWCLITQS